MRGSCFPASIRLSAAYVMPVASETAASVNKRRSLAARNRSPTIRMGASDPTPSRPHVGIYDNLSQTA